MTRAVVQYYLHAHVDVSAAASAASSIEDVILRSAPDGRVLCDAFLGFVDTRSAVELMTGLEPSFEFTVADDATYTVWLTPRAGVELVRRTPHALNAPR